MFHFHLQAEEETKCKKVIAMINRVDFHTRIPASQLPSGRCPYPILR